VRRRTVVFPEARGYFPLATVVLEELGAALAPGWRHAAVAYGAGLAHPITPGRCHVHHTRQEQGNHKHYRRHAADWPSSHLS